MYRKPSAYYTTKKVIHKLTGIRRLAPTVIDRIPHLDLNTKEYLLLKSYYKFVQNPNDIKYQEMYHALMRDPDYKTIQLLLDLKSRFVRYQPENMQILYNVWKNRILRPSERDSYVHHILEDNIRSGYYPVLPIELYDKLDVRSLYFYLYHLEIKTPEQEQYIYNLIIKYFFSDIGDIFLKYIYFIPKEILINLDPEFVRNYIYTLDSMENKKPILRHYLEKIYKDPEFVYQYLINDSTRENIPLRIVGVHEPTRGGKSKKRKTKKRKTKK